MTIHLTPQIPPLCVRNLRNSLTQLTYSPCLGMNELEYNLLYAELVGVPKNELLVI